MKNTIKAIILAMLLTSLSQLVSAAPQNDNWVNAPLLPPSTSGYIAGAVTGATVQPCEPNHVFPDEGTAIAKKTVWYKFVAVASGSYTFSFNGPSTTIDPVLSAYKMMPGMCNGEIATIPYRIVENHNYNHDLGMGQDSRIVLRAAANEAIYISVDNYNTQDGNFGLMWARTRFRYDANLDYKNGGADLVVNRTTPFGTIQWWTARYGSSLFYNEFAVQTYGRS